VSYSILTGSSLSGTDDGCPGQWYLIDKHDNPSCAGSCPPGWVQQIDHDLDVKWCKQPVDMEDLPTIDEASEEYLSSEAGIGVGGMVAIGTVAVLAGVGGFLLYKRRAASRQPTRSMP
jgi:hypothetical protein